MAHLAEGRAMQCHCTSLKHAKEMRYPCVDAKPPEVVPEKVSVKEEIRNKAFYKHPIIQTDKNGEIIETEESYVKVSDVLKVLDSHVCVPRKQLEELSDSLQCNTKFEVLTDVCKLLTFLLRGGKVKHRKHKLLLEGEEKHQ